MKELKHTRRMLTTILASGMIFAAVYCSEEATAPANESVTVTISKTDLMAVTRNQAQLANSTTAKAIDLETSGWNQTWADMGIQYREIQKLITAATQKEQQKDPELQRKEYIAQLTTTWTETQEMWTQQNRSYQALYKQWSNLNTDYSNISRLYSTYLAPIDTTWSQQGLDPAALTACYTEISKECQRIEKEYGIIINTFIDQGKHWQSETKRIAQLIEERQYN